jgi:hypothetical protein
MISCLLDDAVHLMRWPSRDSVIMRLLHRRSVNGQRYFTTSGPMRGVFVRPERVVVGDYPEVDEFADMMDDSEDEI